MGRNKKKQKKVLVEGSESDEDNSDNNQNSSGAEEPAAADVPASSSGGKKHGKNAPAPVADAPSTAASASSAPATAAAPATVVEEAEVTVTRLGPVKVNYCPACTFPAEMCEYSGMFEKCKPWLAEQLAADEAALLADAEEKGRKRRVLTEHDRIDALLSGKGKKKVDQAVVLEVKVRSGKKKVTLVHGLDLFGHNMEDVARQLKKVFCCGAGVASAAGQLDFIEIQGDFIQQLMDLLPAKYSVPAQCVFYMDGKTKLPAHPEQPSAPQSAPPAAKSS